MKEKCKSGNLLLAFGLWLLAAIALTSCGEKSGKQAAGSQQPAVVYYCPMHPHVQQDHPGKCPVEECHGMDLVLKTPDDLLDKTLKPVNTAVLASIKTVKPVFQKIPFDVEANGFIDYDNRSAHNVSSLYSGRIEKLYIKSPFQPVRKGEILFEIYSPELVTAQENLLYILNNDPDEIRLIDAAKQKLALLGITEKQRDEIIKTKKIQQTISVYSNYEGHAHTAMKNNSGEMNTAFTEEKKNGAKLYLKEGMYVMMGETVINIMNQQRLVITLQINADDVSRVKVGSKAEIKIDGTLHSMNGMIDFIEPVFREGIKTATAKIYFDNQKHHHKVGSFVVAKIKSAETETLWIPLSALVDLGREKIVWVKRDGMFAARKVETGTMTNTMVEIADGLTEEDEIAAEAHYLVDSEGFIKINEEENEY